MNVYPLELQLPHPHLNGIIKNIYNSLAYTAKKKLDTCWQEQDIFMGGAHYKHQESWERVGGSLLGHWSTVQFWLQ